MVRRKTRTKVLATTQIPNQTHRPWRANHSCRGKRTPQLMRSALMYHIARRSTLIKLLRFKAETFIEKTTAIQPQPFSCGWPRLPYARRSLGGDRLSLASAFAARG